MHNVILFILQHVIIIYQCIFSRLLVNFCLAFSGPVHSTLWLLVLHFQSGIFRRFVHFLVLHFLAGPAFSVDPKLDVCVAVH